LPAILGRGGGKKKGGELRRPVPQRDVVFFFSTKGGEKRESPVEIHRPSGREREIFSAKNTGVGKKKKEKKKKRQPRGGNPRTMEKKSAKASVKKRKKGRDGAGCSANGKRGFKKKRGGRNAPINALAGGEQIVPSSLPLWGGESISLAEKEKEEGVRTKFPSAW